MADKTKFSAVRTSARGNFTLNKMHTTTGDFFRFDVVHMVPCVPHDVMNLNVQTYIDSAPNPFPINGSMRYGLYAFFVPNRLVWKDWKFYITDMQDLTQPYFTLGDLWDAFHSEANPWAEDYFDDGVRYISNIRNLSAICHFLYEGTKSNIPTSWLNLKFNGYALRAINRIWFDWLRDKAHISDNAFHSYCIDTGGHMSVSELIQLCTPKYRCYSKNYITTAFESPQEGAGSLVAGKLATDLNPGLVIDGAGENALGVSNSPDKVYASVLSDPGVAPRADSNDIVSQMSINDFRFNNSLQQFKELLLVAGKTIKSRALAIFQTSPTIEELQMTNYLGGHEEDLYFKTSDAPSSTRRDANESDTPTTVFGASPNYSTVAGQKFQNIQTRDDKGFTLNNISYKTDETGYLVVLGCITPVVQYFQGLPRDWFRGTDTFASDQFDYFHQEFENQPLQPVLNYEVCCGKYVSPKGVFGFQQNYVDYKLELDSLGGDFVNPKSSELMKNMHLGRNIYDEIGKLGTETPGGYDEFLTPAILTPTDGWTRELLDQKFTIQNSAVDHFRINHKIAVTANRPMSEVTLPSLDSQLSRNSSKAVVDTGGFRL